MINLVLRRTRPLILLGLFLGSVFLLLTGGNVSRQVSAVCGNSSPGSTNLIPDLGAGASLHGNRPFPYNNPWNEDISRLPVEANSDNLIATIGSGTGLHADFGTVYQGAPNGIPYVVVAGDQPRVPITFNQFGPQSDPGPYPVPPDAPIEGGPLATSGDRHVLVIDRDNWKLYEMYAAALVNQGASWTAGSGAIFNLNSNGLRPAGWTSADAAGLPIFPGLVRYDEVMEQREIKHAIRFTIQTSRQSYVYPARHQAGSTTSLNAPPMGMRVRLKASTNIATYSSDMQVILRAMKKYGMIVADNGSNWYVNGAPDPRWSDDDLHNLSGIKGSDFEVVQTTGHLDLPVGDFDGDGKTDISVFRPGEGAWYVRQSTDGVFRAGIWYILQSSDGSFRASSFGAGGDIPVPGDFDGDGKIDLAVFRQGIWYWLRSSNNAVRSSAFGAAGDKPVPGDFDGDGITDVAVWRPSTGVWYMIQSSSNTVRALAFGSNGDQPVTGDYDADGKTDLAVFRPSTGGWYVLQSMTNTVRNAVFGSAGDVPVPADYDRDGRTDLAVFRSGVWYILNSFDSTLSASQFGSPGDIPVPGLR